MDFEAFMGYRVTSERRLRVASVHGPQPGPSGTRSTDLPRVYSFSVVGTVSTPSLIWPVSVERPSPVLRVGGPRPSELRAGLDRVRGVNQAQVRARHGLIRDGVETVPTLRKEEAKHIPPTGGEGARSEKKRGWLAPASL